MLFTLDLVGILSMALKIRHADAMEGQKEKEWEKKRSLSPEIRVDSIEFYVHYICI